MFRFVFTFWMTILVHVMWMKNCDKIISSFTIMFNKSIDFNKNMWAECSLGHKPYLSVFNVEGYL